MTPSRGTQLPMRRTQQRRVFHLMPARNWRTEQARSTVADDQFERHGFVHCCYREQIQEIASWWFEDEELTCLEIEPQHLGAELRHEASPERWYPHVYGSIDRRAVAEAHEMPRAEDGAPALPAALASPPPAFVVEGRIGSTKGAVRWQDGQLSGCDPWVAAAHAAVDRGDPVELFGGVIAPASLDSPFAGFSLLADVADEVSCYQGDGWFDAEATA